MIRIGFFTLWCGMVACVSTNDDIEKNESAAYYSEGYKIYTANCKACHGENGKLGVGGAKDISTSTLTEDQMIAIIKTGKGRMAGYKSILDEKEIEAVADYVKKMGKE